MKQTDLPGVPRGVPVVPASVAARRASIIVAALGGAPSSYFAQVADGFESWAADEERAGNLDHAASLRIDAEVWRAR